MSPGKTFEGLGKALRWLRDKQAHKQYQVAEKAGVTKAMLSAYETGKQNPSIDTLEKILGALKVDLPGLFHALQVVNERTGLVAANDSGATSRTRLTPTHEPDVDVYRTLGLDRPLSLLEEEAMADMLRGFGKLLRHFHDELAAARAAALTKEDGPAEA
jgi:HTH-type transcriptional regulator / antitoxin HipB